MERYGLEEKRNSRRGHRQYSKSHSSGKAPYKGGFGKKYSNGGRGGQEHEKKEREHNPADLRRANRTDRERSPEIDEDVTGRELSQPVNRELSALDERNRKWVAKHLIMAGRLLEEDPELAFEHSLAASRRGGRLGVVREAVGLAAYAAGEYAEALREFRTYRRISGDNSYIAEMVDCERALDRREKALETASEVDLETLSVRSRVELAMVVSGIYQDLGDAEAAVEALRIPELNPKRGFAYSPRLFNAYADALEFAGQTKQAGKWRSLSARAARALGQDIEPDPVIFDVSDDPDEVEVAPGGSVFVPPQKYATSDRGKRAVSFEQESAVNTEEDVSSEQVENEPAQDMEPGDARSADDTTQVLDIPDTKGSDEAGARASEDAEDEDQEKLW